MMTTSGSLLVMFLVAMLMAVAFRLGGDIYGSMKNMAIPSV